MTEKSLLTVKEKILLHLSEFPAERYVSDESQTEIFGVLPHDLSQKGIADAVGIRWNHVPRSLKGLVNDELIQVRTGMVEGHMRRVNIYFLTMKGIDEAKDIKEKLEAVEIKIRTGDEVEDVPIFTLVERLGGGVSPLTVLVVANDGKDVVQMEALEKFISEDKEMSTRVHMLSDAPKPRNFIGRDRELESVRKIISERKVLVITGITGIGKSTLLAKVIDEFTSDYSVLWCNVTEWDTIRSILSRLAEFFSLNASRELKKMISRSSFQTNEAIELIGENLGDVPSLFVFDNYEKANDELAGFFGQMFEALSGKDLKMVVVSRTTPEFYDRRDVNIRSHVGELKLSGLSFEGTEEMLSSRGFSGPNIDILYKITGGHPLSLELIRNPDDVKKPSDLYRFVQDELLSGLEEEERKLLNYASVLTYPNEIDALLYIDPPMEALDRLIDLHLIQDLPSGMIYLQNLLREVTYSRLSEAEIKEHCKNAADYFIGKETVFDSLKGIRYLLKGEYYDDASEILGKVGNESLNRGLIAEVKSILTDLEGNIPTDQFYKIYILQGDMYFLETDHENAREYYDKALNSSSTTNFVARSHAFRQLGLLELSLGNVDDANNNLQIALDMANQSKDKGLLAMVNGAIARLFIHKGEHGKAKELLELAIQYAVEGTHDIEYHDLLIDMGSIYISMGDMDKALELAKVSLDFFEGRKDVFKLGRVYDLMGECHFSKGDIEKAHHYWEMAVESGRRSGSHELLGFALMNSVRALAEMEKHDDALERLQEAERIHGSDMDHILMGHLNMAYGIVHASKGNHEDALEYLNKSLELAEKGNAPIRIAEKLFLIGRVHRDMGQDKQAKTFFNKAKKIFKERGDTHHIQPILDELESMK